MPKHKKRTNITSFLSKQMTMANHKLRVDVSWTGKNFCCSRSDDVAGTVLVTAKSLAKLKEDFVQSLKWHIEGCVADGDVLPDYLVSGD